jgi:hypothetical protein
MRRFSVLVVLVALALGGAMIGPSSAWSQAAPTCDPIQTQPDFRGTTPTAQEVLGFELGSQEVTSAESDRYLDAVDASSDRVVGGTFGTSAQGRPLRFAIVGHEANVEAGRLAEIQDAVRRLMNPRLSDRQAADLVTKTPAILWLAGNVHGNEESPTDSELRILFELGDREDCAAEQILDHAIVVIVPTQNPDGREADTRENFYGFDMNRDWFARTQRETDAKVELLRSFPGQLFVDAHEMGTPTYFFPPNADPVYHEITDYTMDLTDNLYGPAMAAEFNRQGIPFFQNAIFDFFAMVFGDTVPSEGFGAVGMTFEKHANDPIARRTHEHYTTQWVTISTAALNKETVLSRWHDEWVTALEQGRAGKLQPNFVNDPGNTVQREVPSDPVRHYFLRNDAPAKAADVQRLVRRLQRMDVDVFRLSRPLAVPDFKEYGRAPAATVLPTGTFWIPMTQRQKHWIQAMLNEDTYVPFPYFFDVTGWSNPILFNLSGGRSGAVLRPQAARVPLQPEPATPTQPAPVPAVAVFQPGVTQSARQSTGWLRYLFEQRWNLPYTQLTADQIAAGALESKDVLIVPSGSATQAFDALGPAGRSAVTEWVRDGGRYVGFRRGGTPLAARLGMTTVTLREPTSDVAGALLRVRVAPGTPLGAAVGPFNFVFYDFDLVMEASNPAHSALSYPAASSPDFFISGFGEGHEELGGTTAVADEPFGSGRVVLFSTDPNFRAWTEGMQRVLRNAVLGPNPVRASASRGTARERAASSVSASSLVRFESPIRISVERRSARATRALIARYTERFLVQRADGEVTFVIANPRGLAADQHPFAMLLAKDVSKAGIDPIAFRAP